MTCNDFNFACKFQFYRLDYEVIIYYMKLAPSFLIHKLHVENLSCQQCNLDLMKIFFQYDIAYRILLIAVANSCKLSYYVKYGWMWAKNDYILQIETQSMESSQAYLHTMHMH